MISNIKGRAAMVIGGATGFTLNAATRIHDDDTTWSRFITFINA